MNKQFWELIVSINTYLRALQAEDKSIEFKINKEVTNIIKKHKYKYLSCKIIIW